jgi:hypothetical protein
MARSLITLFLYRRSYSNLATFAQSIHDGFVSLALIFTTPNPLMAMFQADIDTLNVCIQAWESTATRTRTDLNNLRAAAQKVRTDLRMLADYAQNTRPDDPDIYEQLGFEVKKTPSAPQELQMVRELRIFVSRTVPSTNIKLKWKRPLATDPGDVKFYLIQKNNVPVRPLIESSKGVVNGVAGLALETTFTLEPPYEGPNYFWVTPVNAAGYGVSSDLLFFNAPVKLVE